MMLIGWFYNCRWVASLSDYWSRKVDVVNRGFSGYNSRWGLSIISNAVLSHRPDLVVIFFGANDAVIPEGLTHVLLPDFISNIENMVLTLRKVFRHLTIVVASAPFHPTAFVLRSLRNCTLRRYYQPVLLCWSLHHRCGNLICRGLAYWRERWFLWIATITGAISTCFNVHKSLQPFTSKLNLGAFFLQDKAVRHRNHSISEEGLCYLLSLHVTLVEIWIFSIDNSHYFSLSAQHPRFRRLVSHGWRQWWAR